MNKLLYCTFLALACFIFSLFPQCVEGRDMDIQTKYDQMLYPVVKVESGQGYGSGVVIYSDEFTLILTAKHVIKPKKKVRVTVYPDEITYPAKVVKVSKEFDLALLRIETKVEHVAHTVALDELPIFAKVYKVGGGNGHKPFPTVGVVGDTEHEHFFSFSAQVVGGDSGGGVFLLVEKQYVLVGIVTALALESGGEHVHHIGYAHNISAISAFLAEQ